MPSRIPKPTRGIDIFSLPLSTKEGFVLSRIDGVSSVEDISMMVGVKVPELLSMLDKLAGLGAVQLDWRAQAREREAAAPYPPASALEAPPSPRGEDHPLVQRVLKTPLVPLYTEIELESPADLTFDQKRRILNAYYGLEGKDFYELLGLPRNADKKDIRVAYFELSRLFHPDSMFGRHLGTFQAKMESVFMRLTEAYEVLGRKQRRAEYDEYLASTATTSAMQHTLDRVDSEVRALSSAPPRISEPKLASDPARAAPQPSAANQAVAAAVAKSGNPPPQEEGRLSSVGMRPPASLEERKAHARERLRRSFAGAPTGPNPQPPSAAVAPSAPSAPVAPAARSSVIPPGAARNGAERRDSAIKGLRQSLSQSTSGSGGVGPVLAHLRRAKDAEQAGDLLAAAAALQAALTLQPNHKDIQAQYDRVSKAVTRKLADNYEKQARYEEKQGKWAAAALSWERVSDGRPENVEAARAVAEALLKASGDMRKAQRFAQRAVDAAPSDITNVVVLARVLLAAGLRLNARRELEKAVKLDPQNEMIKNLLREAR